MPKLDWSQKSGLFRSLRTVTCLEKLYIVSCLVFTLYVQKFLDTCSANICSEIKGINSLFPSTSVTTSTCLRRLYTRCWNICIACIALWIWLYWASRVLVRPDTDAGWLVWHFISFQRYWKELHHCRERSSTALQPSVGGLYTPLVNSWHWA